MMIRSQSGKWYLPISEMEELWGLLEDKTESDEKKDIATQLATCFSDGGEGVIIDESKAQKYRDFLKKAKSIKQTSSATSALKLFDDWTNPVRLMVLRIDRILQYYEHSFLPAHYNIFGVLTYPLRLLIDLIQSIDLARSSMTKEEKELSPWRFGYWKAAVTHFYDALCEEGRPARIANSIAWTTVLSVLFVMTGGIATYLYAGLFIFLVINEAVKLGTGKLKAQKSLLQKLKLDRENETKPEEIEALDNKISKLENNIIASRDKIVWRVICLIALALSMIAFLFAPVGGVIAMAGAMGSLFFGSTILGFGEKALATVGLENLDKKSLLIQSSAMGIGGTIGFLAGTLIPIPFLGNMVGAFIGATVGYLFGVIISKIIKPSKITQKPVVKTGKIEKTENAPAIPYNPPILSLISKIDKAEEIKEVSETENTIIPSTPPSPKFLTPSPDSAISESKVEENLKNEEKTTPSNVNPKSSHSYLFFDAPPTNTDLNVTPKCKAFRSIE